MVEHFFDLNSERGLCVTVTQDAGKPRGVQAEKERGREGRRRDECYDEMMWMYMSLSNMKHSEGGGPVRSARTAKVTGMCR